jgi:TolA-binding protein
MMKRLIYAIVLLISGALVVCAQDYEKAFYNVQQCFEQRAEATQENLQEYLEKYPYTPYVDEVMAMQGIMWSEKGEYQHAIDELEKVDVKNISRTIEYTYSFHMGYALMQLHNYKKALTYLLPLKTQHNSPYTLQASYYAGYCHYNLKEYNKALVEFLSLEHVGGYRKIAPYYVVQIHYALSEYEEVLERAERLLADFPDNEYNDELHRMIGEIYYQDSIYDKAAYHLEQYHKLRVAKGRQILRNDLYLLGISNYSIEQYSQAINYLKQVKQENDSISESTCLHLGHSYLRANNLEKAILAYAAAIQFDINPILREEAMYNYVQATYLQNSALGENITAFQTFIQEYPKSRYIDRVYALMADIYLTSKNYQAALDALLEIQQPSEKVLLTCQYLRYQMAVDAFLQNDMNNALKWAIELIEKEANTTDHKTEAYYLCAQAYYQLQQYPQTIEQINLYQQQPNIAHSENQKTAIYLKAYALFNQKQYTSAEPVYREYISLLANNTSNTYLDALNRLGDCLFHSRHFQDACDTYAQVAQLNSFGADYALLQSGYARGLMHQYAEKVKVLTSLTQQYPNSDYADDALYEIARSELQQEYNMEAINAYQTLLEKYPNSTHTAKASLELGMTYRTLKQYDEAIHAFKHTISTYIGSEESYSALEGIEQILVETNKVDEYIAYTKTLTNINMEVISNEDSLIYVTAELQYMMGNYQQAIAGLNTYLTSFCPGGRYCTNATYYAANSFYQLKQNEQAIEHFCTLADMQGNPYIEEACMRVAELSSDKQEYRTALYYYQRMSEVASSSSKRITALIGMLRCSHHLVEENNTTIDIATRLLNEPILDSIVRHEALYYRAKAYIKDKQYESAIDDLTPVAQEVRTARGAEAKYLIAECQYHMEDINSAEEVIMSFTKQQTSHQYWLAKSLILLADINVKRNELFQAKQYLLALQKNYRVQEDDIQTIIEDKLELIAQMDIQ